MTLVRFTAVLALLSIRTEAAVTSSRAPATSLADRSHELLAKTLASHPAPYGYRSGDSKISNSCHVIRTVPVSLRWGWVMKPSGLSHYYQKYTETYGIPVVGSQNVSDGALSRACYVLRVLLADHSAIRQSFYKLFGRVAVIGSGERVTAVPEYRFLPDHWNERSRGLGATESVPVSSGAEENLLCYRNGSDRYAKEDIFLHELAHGVHLLGAKYAIPGWQRDLERAYESVNKSGLWNDTYSRQSAEEYLAEGIQSYFRVNAFSDPADGVHGPVDSPEKLRDYDPALYRLIELMFPCGNTVLQRCNSTRESEHSQVLKTNCDLTREYQLKLPEFTPESCEDKSKYCHDWAKQGECEVNPSYMQVECRSSCQWCGKPLVADPTPRPPPVTGTCTDGNIYCTSWADLGECDSNAAYMREKCQKSCGLCAA